jgi:hypothetical protein
MTAKKQKQNQMRKQAKALANTVPSQINCTADEWAKTPEIVRVEIWRAILELSSGLEQYAPNAKTFESVRKYDDMARASGTTLAEALERYTKIEAFWRQDPVLATAGNFGLTPETLLSQVTDGLINDLDARLYRIGQMH